MAPEHLSERESQECVSDMLAIDHKRVQDRVATVARNNDHLLHLQLGGDYGIRNQRIILEQVGVALFKDPKIRAQLFPDSVQTESQAMVFLLREDLRPSLIKEYIQLAITLALEKEAKVKKPYMRKYVTARMGSHVLKRVLKFNQIVDSKPTSLSSGHRAERERLIKDIDFAPFLKDELIPQALLEPCVTLFIKFLKDGGSKTPWDDLQLFAEQSTEEEPVSSAITELIGKLDSIRALRKTVEQASTPTNIRQREILEKVVETPPSPQPKFVFEALGERLSSATDDEDEISLEKSATTAEVPSGVGKSRETIKGLPPANEVRKPTPDEDIAEFLSEEEIIKLGSEDLVEEVEEAEPISASQDVPTGRTKRPTIKFFGIPPAPPAPPPPPTPISPILGKTITRPKLSRHMAPGEVFGAVSRFDAKGNVPKVDERRIEPPLLDMDDVAHEPVQTQFGFVKGVLKQMGALSQEEQSPMQPSSAQRKLFSGNAIIRAKFLKERDIARKLKEESFIIKEEIEEVYPKEATEIDLETLKGRIELLNQKIARLYEINQEMSALKCIENPQIQSEIGSLDWILHWAKASKGRDLSMYDKLKKEEALINDRNTASEFLQDAQQIFIAYSECTENKIGPNTPLPIKDLEADIEYLKGQTAELKTILDAMSLLKHKADEEIVLLQQEIKKIYDELEDYTAKIVEYVEGVKKYLEDPPEPAFEEEENTAVVSKRPSFVRKWALRMVFAASMITAAVAGKAVVTKIMSEKEVKKPTATKVAHVTKKAKPTIQDLPITRFQEPRRAAPMQPGMGSSMASPMHSAMASSPMTTPPMQAAPAMTPTTPRAAVTPTAPPSKPTAAPAPTPPTQKSVDVRGNSSSLLTSINTLDISNLSNGTLKRMFEGAEFSLENEPHRSYSGLMGRALKDELKHQYKNGNISKAQYRKALSEFKTLHKNLERGWLLHMSIQEENMEKLVANGQELTSKQEAQLTWWKKYKKSNKKRKWQAQWLHNSYKRLLKSGKKGGKLKWYKKILNLGSELMDGGMAVNNVQDLNNVQSAERTGFRTGGKVLNLLVKFAKKLKLIKDSKTGSIDMPTMHEEVQLADLTITPEPTPSPSVDQTPDAPEASPTPVPAPASVLATSAPVSPLPPPAAMPPGGTLEPVLSIHAVTNNMIVDSGLLDPPPIPVDAQVHELSEKDIFDVKPAINHLASRTPVPPPLPPVEAQFGKLKPVLKNILDKKRKTPPPIPADVRKHVSVYDIPRGEEFLNTGGESDYVSLDVEGKVSHLATETPLPRPPMPAEAQFGKLKPVLEDMQVNNREVVLQSNFDTPNNIVGLPFTSHTELAYFDTQVETPIATPPPIPAMAEVQAPKPATVKKNVWGRVKELFGRKVA